MTNSSSSSQEIFEQIRSSLEGTQYSTNAVVAGVIVTFSGILVIMLLIWMFWKHLKSVYMVKAFYRNELEGKTADYEDSTLQKCIVDSWRLSDSDVKREHGMDAYSYIMALKMVRNMFAVFTVVLFGIAAPINIVYNMKQSQMYISLTKRDSLLLLTPALLGKKQMITHVVLGYVTNLVLFAFVWYYYLRVYTQRSVYMNSTQYHTATENRTLMVLNIKDKQKNCDCVSNVCSGICPTADLYGVTMGQNTAYIRSLIGNHEQQVVKLEKYIYCRKPNSRKAVEMRDKIQSKIAQLEAMIEEERAKACKPGNFAFVTCSSVHDAQTLYRSSRRSKTPVKFQRCPPNNHVIWHNISLKTSQRVFKQFIMNVVYGALLFIWIVPSALIGCFLANLSRLAAVWPDFSAAMKESPVGFAILQGVLAPAITTLIFIALPYIFRKFSFLQGKLTKTEREKEVLRKLFMFFFIDNFLIFTLMGVIWDIVTQVVQVTTANSDSGVKLTATEIWNSLQLEQRVATAIVNISSFWVMYLLRTVLGIFVNTAKPVLVMQKIGQNFNWIKQSSPRQLATQKLPDSFQYATSYVTLLFNVTIAMAFTTIQPLVIPITFLLFVFLVVLKKYELMNISYTKYESHGEFWPLMCDVVLFSGFFGNLVLLCVVWAQSDWRIAVAIIPLPVLVIVFKLVLFITLNFDDQRPTVEPLIPMGAISDTPYGDPALTMPLEKPLTCYEDAFHALCAKSNTIALPRRGKYFELSDSDSSYASSLDQKSNVNFGTSNTFTELKQEETDETPFNSIRRHDYQHQL